MFINIRYWIVNILILSFIPITTCCASEKRHDLNYIHKEIEKNVSQKSQVSQFLHSQVYDYNLFSTRADHFFSPFLFFESKEASFKITKQSLDNIKSEGVPGDVIKALKNIESQEVIGEEKFLGLLKTTIGKEQTVRYRSIILKHGKETDQLTKMITIYMDSTAIKVWRAMISMFMSFIFLILISIVAGDAARLLKAYLKGYSIKLGMDIWSDAFKGIFLCVFILLPCLGLICLIFGINFGYSYDELDIIHKVVHSPRIIQKECKNNHHVKVVIEKTQPLFDTLDDIVSSYRTTIHNIYILKGNYSTYTEKTKALTTKRAIILRARVSTILEKNIERLYDIAASLQVKAIQTEQILYPLEKKIIDVYDLSTVSNAAAEAFGQKYHFDATVLEDDVIDLRDIDEQSYQILNESEKLLKYLELVTISQ